MNWSRLSSHKLRMGFWIRIWLLRYFWNGDNCWITISVTQQHTMIWINLNYLQKRSAKIWTLTVLFQYLENGWTRNLRWPLRPRMKYLWNHSNNQRITIHIGLRVIRLRILNRVIWRTMMLWLELFLKHKNKRHGKCSKNTPCWQTQEIVSVKVIFHCYSRICSTSRMQAYTKKMEDQKIILCEATPTKIYKRSLETRRMN